MKPLLVFALLLTLVSCDLKPTNNAGVVSEQGVSVLTSSRQENTDSDIDENGVADVAMSITMLTDTVGYVKGEAGIATDNQGFISNAGVVFTSEGVVLFDALGTPALARKLRLLIAQKTNKKIIAVVLSHYHADHIYGLQVFEKLGAKIFAPTGAEKYIYSDVASNRLKERQESLYPWVNEQTHIVEPDEYINKPTILTFGDHQLDISWLGSAHSDGDLTMVVSPDNVMFSGDIIFQGRIPFIGNADTGHWLESLKQLSASDVKAIVPGHGESLDDPQQTLQSTLDYLSYLRENLSVAVEDFVPFDEVYDSMSWDDFKDLPAFEQANRRNAYQVYLSLESEALTSTNAK